MKLSDFMGEATEYDKKEMLEERKPKSWLKSVSAFANGIGGALFFGVSNDEVLVGLDDAKGISEKISEAIKTKMDPAPQVILEIHAEDGKKFVVLRVPSGQETPYYYTGDGNRIAYVRIGNESVPASAVDLKRLVLRGSNTSFDSLSTRYSFESLAFTKLRSVYRMRTGTELTDSDFVSFDLVDENNMLTNAGVLLADESPMRPLACSVPVGTAWTKPQALWKHLTIRNTAVHWYLCCRTAPSSLRTIPRNGGKRPAMDEWRCLNTLNRQYMRSLSMR